MVGRAAPHGAPRQLPAPPPTPATHRSMPVVPAGLDEPALTLGELGESIEGCAIRDVIRDRGDSRAPDLSSTPDAVPLAQAHRRETVVAGCPGVPRSWTICLPPPTGRRPRRTTFVSPPASCAASGSAPAIGSLAEPPPKDQEYWAWAVDTVNDRSRRPPAAELRLAAPASRTRCSTSRSTPRTSPSD
jgi:hypothetical protein